MRFIKHEPVRFVLAGGLNTVTTRAAYLVLLPLIGYRHRVQRDLRRPGKDADVLPACWPSSCSPREKNPTKRRHRACRVNGS
jgi:hypothetical protein